MSYSLLSLLSFCFSIAVVTAGGLIGFDTTNIVLLDDLACLRAINRASFAVYQAWFTKSYDMYGIGNIRTANAAGYKKDMVDGYMIPCMDGCSHGANQMEAIINKLQVEKVEIGTLWIGVQSEYYGKNTTANSQFLLDMVSQATKMKMAVGVRTSRKEWHAIVGTRWTGLADLPLFWIEANGREDMKGFESFGGWNEPTLHLFASEHEIRCVDIDIDSIVKKASTINKEMGELRIAKNP